ncbi:hypothetical protein [Streptomyces phaeochromogenes]|uniref:hypothetical protein n=1 Tax=Streptomyces phaeochromogenes TaxID=1923 RepID=UPI003722E8DD
MDTLGFMAAPLFAGAALATIGVLGADSDKFRWPALSMLMLTLAAIALAASIQLALRGRRFLYSAGEVHSLVAPLAPRSQRGDREQEELDELPTDFTTELQADDFDQWLTMSSRAAWAYQTGLVLLGIGLASILAPPVTAGGSDAVLRWISVGAVLCALVVHAILLVQRVLRSHDGALIDIVAAVITGR